MERRRRLTSLRSVLLRYLCLCGGGCALILVLWWGIFMQLIDNGFLLSATASAQACAEARETVASVTADTFENRAQRPARRQRQPGDDAVSVHRHHG